jgi:hypothetical protein
VWYALRHLLGLSRPRILFTLLLVLGACPVAPSYAAPLLNNPTVETWAPIAVKDTTATLYGMFSINPPDTLKTISYRFTLREGSAQAPLSETYCPQQWTEVTSDITELEVKCPASGLKPGTSYAYALFVHFYRQGNLETYSGPWRDFWTLSPSEHPKTDWALSNLMLFSSPQVGQHVASAVRLTALSSDAPYPQIVTIGVEVDGIGVNVLSGGQYYYYGPTGTAITLTDETWVATPGTHTIKWTADSISHAYLDPDRSNNERSLTFTTGEAPSNTFDFTMTLSPTSNTVKPGETVSYKVLLSYSDQAYYNTPINIQLTGLGPGMEWQISQTGDLTITTLSTTPTGTYSFTVVGSALGVTRQIAGTLIVTQQSITTATTAISSATTSLPFDYSVTVSPSTESAEVGGSTSYVVSVLPVAGHPPTVSLTVLGLPGDVRSSFTVTSSTPPYTSTLSLDLSTSTASPGAYTLTILASAGGIVKTATATLMIEQKTTQTTVAQTTASGSSWSDLVQQNSLIVITALLALALVFGVLATRGRTRRTVTQQVGPAHTFCGRCGAENPMSNEFCRKCGNKLKDS